MSESAWQPMLPLALMQVLAPHVIEQQALPDVQLSPSAPQGRSNPSPKIGSTLLVLAVSATLAAGCGARPLVAMSSRRRRSLREASSARWVPVPVSSICRRLGAGACGTVVSTARVPTSADMALPAGARRATQNQKTTATWRSVSRVQRDGTRTTPLMTTAGEEGGNDAMPMTGYTGCRVLSIRCVPGFESRLRFRRRQEQRGSLHGKGLPSEKR